MGTWELWHALYVDASSAGRRRTVGLALDRPEEVVPPGLPRDLTGLLRISVEYRAAQGGMLGGRDLAASGWRDQAPTDLG